MRCCPRRRPFRCDGTHHLGAAPKVGETLGMARCGAASGWRWRRFRRRRERDAWIGWTRATSNRRWWPTTPGSCSCARCPTSGAGLAGTFHHPPAGDLHRGHGLPGRGLDRARMTRAPPRPGYRAGSTPKKVFVRVARPSRATPTLEPRYRHGRPRTMLSADGLPDVFRTIAAATGADRLTARCRAIPSGCATSRRRATSAAAVSGLRATELSAQRIVKVARCCGPRPTARVAPSTARP